MKKKRSLIFLFQSVNVVIRCFQISIGHPSCNCQFLNKKNRIIIDSQLPILLESLETNSGITELRCVSYISTNRPRADPTCHPSRCLGIWWCLKNSAAATFSTRFPLPTACLTQKFQTIITDFNHSASCPHSLPGDRRVIIIIIHWFCENICKSM
jgi:hypothetical protein